MGFIESAFGLIGRLAEKALDTRNTRDRKAYPAPSCRPAKKNDPAAEIRNEQNRGNQSLTEAEIPEGIVRIGRSAFRDCKNLTRVKLPSTLEYIGDNAFTGCEKLTEITVPEGVMEIGNGAFADCASLVSVTLPQSLNVICGGLFYNCRSLENIVMPKRIYEGFCNVFPHCESLKGFDIPYGADELGAFTFEYCYSLERLTIPDTVKYIGHRSIMYCTRLKEVYIPDSVEQIACLHTFYRCDSLEKVRLPLSVSFRDILDEHTEDKAARCFAECPDLHTVEMCGQEFHIDRMNDEALLLVRTELTVNGCREAEKYVLPELPRIFTALVDHDLPDLAARLLSYLPRSAVKPDELLAAIDYAANAGSHQIYLLLVQFRSGGDIPPHDSDEIGERFSL